MKMLVPASLLLLVMAGCQNQHAQQLNPFNVYGAQRLPPPGTQSYGQPATTQPYYPGPAANQAPTLNGGYPNGGYQNGPYQTQPPAQLAPPPNSTPMNGSSYQGGGWQSTSSNNSRSSSSDVAHASYTEEADSPTSSSQATISSSGSTSSSIAPTVTGDSTSSSSNPYLNGMRVNEVSQTTEPLAPAPTSTLPSDGWGAPAPLPSASAPIQAIPTPSRIP